MTSTFKITSCWAYFRFFSPDSTYESFRYGDKSTNGDSSPFDILNTRSLNSSEGTISSANPVVCTKSTSPVEEVGIASPDLTHSMRSGSLYIPATYRTPWRFIFIADTNLKIEPPEGTLAKIAFELTNPIGFPSSSNRNTNGPRPMHKGAPTLGPCIRTEFLASSDSSRYTKSFRWTDMPSPDPVSKANEDSSTNTVLKQVTSTFENESHSRGIVRTTRNWFTIVSMSFDFWNCFWIPTLNDLMLDFCCWLRPFRFDPLFWSWTKRHFAPNLHFPVSW